MIDRFAEGRATTSGSMWTSSGRRRRARSARRSPTATSLLMIDGLRRDLLQSSGFKLGGELRLEQGPLSGAGAGWLAGPGEHEIVSVDDVGGGWVAGGAAIHRRGGGLREALLRGRQRRSRADLALETRHTRPSVPGLDDHLVAGLVEPDHHQPVISARKRCQGPTAQAPSRASACAPRRRPPRRVPRSSGSPPQSDGLSDALCRANRGSRRRSSASTARHMLPNQTSPSSNWISVPLMRGAPSRRSVASVLCT